MPYSRFFLFISLISMIGISASDAAAEISDDIRVSSVGYPSQTAKIASVVGKTSGDFFVYTEEGTEIFAGTLSANGSVGQANFSEVTETGNYYVHVPEMGESIIFPISEDAALMPFEAVMLGFYAWRSGIDIGFSWGGEEYTHAAGHLNDALIDFVTPAQAGTLVDATGGWCDAGDYGKYIVNSGCALAPMLRAYEEVGDRLEKVTLSFIPETGGNIPDYLDEVKYNLDWMLKMQFDDGRVSHKLTPIDFAEFIMPAEDDLDRYISPWGSAATADFTATMAQASRIFRPYDETYADTLLFAARLSYDYLVAHPDNVSADLSDFENQQYSTDDWDDRIWAAAEIWVTTGDADALADFETRVQNQPEGWSGPRDLLDHTWDWGDLKNPGIFSYLATTRDGRSDTLVQNLEAAVIASADAIVDEAFNGEEGFGRGFDTDTYFWGSNGLVARSCMVLRRAFEQTLDETYMNACMQQIANLFGRNQYNRSYITGVGLNPPQHPHCRRSGASGHTYPGYVVGGGQSNDDWEDEEESYSTNEIAINWQGALAYALALFVPEDGNATTDTDSDTNMDTDDPDSTDNDSDTAGDTESAADADSDTDADADGDSDTDADSDSDADIDSDVDSDADGDSDADSDDIGGTDADVDADADSDSDADSDADSDTDTDDDNNDDDNDNDDKEDTGPEDENASTSESDSTGTSGCGCRLADASSTRRYSLWSLLK